MTTPPTALRAFRAPLTASRLAPQQVRHATLLRRPKRPYTFTQLITLSDGSSFTVRTTSPEPVYKSAKDIRNNPLWNPSSQKLLNVEEDEAGRLAAFRAKYGRSWDSEGDVAQAKDTKDGKDAKSKVCGLRSFRGLRWPEFETMADVSQTQPPEDHLLDLIAAQSKSAKQSEPKAPAKAPAKPAGKK
jgi:hypothetical protein